MNIIIRIRFVGHNKLLEADFDTGRNALKAFIDELEIACVAWLFFLLNNGSCYIYYVGNNHPANDYHGGRL